jgi:N-acetylneuraminate synthase
MSAAPTYVIAEAGVNHDGAPERALQLVDAAADAGADAIKFQLFRPDSLAGRTAAKAEYQKLATDAGEGQLAMLRRLELPRESFKELQARAAARGLDFLCTPFDPGSLDHLLGALRLRTIKVGSGDLTNAPLLLAIARAGARVILSTGMATLAEIEEALSVLAFGYGEATAAPGRERFAAAYAGSEGRARLGGRVTLLHCTTEYPAPPASINLAGMDTLRAAFALPVGFSDHSLGHDIAVAAVARGAVMIEKHLTLDRALPGPDHAASLEPGPFRAMVAAIRAVEAAIGDGRKVAQPAELANRTIARRSLVAARPIAKGERFTLDNLAVKRPAGGLAPIELWSLVGRPAPRDFAVDDPVEY